MFLINLHAHVLHSATAKPKSKCPIHSTQPGSPEMFAGGCELAALQMALQHSQIGSRVCFGVGLWKEGSKAVTTPRWLSILPSPCLMLLPASRRTVPELRTGEGRACLRPPFR